MKQNRMGKVSKKYEYFLELKSIKFHIDWFTDSQQKGILKYSNKGTWI